MKTANKIMMPNGEEIGIDGLYGKITNCLLEVPQRVKLELNNGVLTLKAGSQVIIPNGFEEDGVTPRFDYLDIESDKTYVLNYSTTDKIVLMWDLKYSVLGTERFSIMSSGTTPSNYDQYGTWYDTNANIVKYTNDSGATWISSRSLPIAILNTDGASTITSINQTFNGMGYIGSTIWVDKGVKGLIPNGRNEDGTLNNIEFTTDKVMTTNLTFTGTQDIRLGLSALGSGDLVYNPVKNWNTPENNDELRWFIPIGKATATSGIITSFNPKQPFRAVDYSDKAEIVSWGMPDYSAGINKGLSFTSDGYYLMYVTGRWNQNTGGAKVITISINGVEFILGMNYAEAGQDCFYLAPSDVVNITYTVSTVTATLYPLKGAK